LRSLEEKDQNFHIITTEQVEYMLKILNRAEEYPHLQIQALNHIHSVDPTFRVPRVIQSLNNEQLVQDTNGNSIILFTFVKGI
jgi:Ser/Thr protein kinase RdoA (MazF antagonist)